MNAITLNDLTINDGATRTNRVFAGCFSDKFENEEGQAVYWDEMSAVGTDKDGNEYRIVWQELIIVGEEIEDDCWNWDAPESIEAI